MLRHIFLLKHPKPASEINDSWNSATKATDLAAISPLCDAVIAAHPLAPNYGDLWGYTGANGANENLKEVILAANFLLTLQQVVKIYSTFTIALGTKMLPKCKEI